MKKRYFFLPILFVGVLFFIFNCDLTELERKKITDAEAVSKDLDSVSSDKFAYAIGDTSSDVNGNFTLPVKGENGSTLTWSASPSIVSINPTTGLATVTRPTDADTTVTLTVTVTKNGETKTKTMTIVIKKDGSVVTTTTTTVAPSSTTTTTVTPSSTTTTIPSFTQTITATISDFYTDSAITFSSGNEVVKGTNLVVSVTETFESYAWYIDGAVQTGQTTGTITISTTSMDIKQYELMIKVVKNGNTYSKTMRFNVISGTL